MTTTDHTPAIAHPGTHRRILDRLLRLSMLLALVAGLPIAALAQDEDVDPEDARIAAVLDANASLEFLETPLPRALEFVQEAHGISIVLDPGVRPVAVTVRVRDVPLRQGLDSMLAGTGLAHVVEDGVLLVTRASRLARRRLEIRNYGVLDLITEEPDFPSPRIGDVATDGGGPGAIFSDEGDGISAFSIDEIVDYILQTIAPETWDEEGTSLQGFGSHLMVVQTPEVHEQIAALLDEFRRFAGKQISVEARYYAVARERLPAVLGDEAARTVFLDAAGRARLAEAGRLLDQLGVVCFNTQRVHAASTRTLSLLRDFDVSIAQSSVVWDPIVALETEGMTLDVRPILSPGAKRVAMEVRSQLVRFDPELRRTPISGGAATTADGGGTGDAATGRSGTEAVVFRGGRVEGVDVRSYQLETFVRVTPGLGATFIQASPLVGDDEVLVLLVTPRPVEEGE